MKKFLLVLVLLVMLVVPAMAELTEYFISIRSKSPVLVSLFEEANNYEYETNDQYTKKRVDLLCGNDESFFLYFITENTFYVVFPPSKNGYYICVIGISDEDENLYAGVIDADKTTIFTVNKKICKMKQM